ncbi:MAG: PAS domain-containing protein [Pseudomonadota bacterium]|nr:PAS domain-containing protein [Pseudomonadota bacterium]
MLKGILGQSKDRSYSFPLIAEVEAYWQGLRQERCIPKRSDLDPRGIRGALTNAFILNVPDHGSARFRIVGSQISSLRQRDLNGSAVSDLISEPRKGIIDDILADVTVLPAKARLNFAQNENDDRVIAQMVLLPMTNEAGQLNRILGCLDFHTTLVRKASPQLLHPTGTVVRSLAVKSEDRVRRMRLPNLHLVSDNQMNLPLRPTSKRSALRLVET